MTDNNANHYDYFEGEEDKIDLILQKGKVGDTVTYIKNNQMGVLYYKIEKDGVKKELKLIGDYDGFFDNSPCE